ncbi:uncharacterized protein EI97DRAFT_271730 [Westerdykella ornata]|uniref:Prion-inhibition and propagation HeLo domain-containing protein n=1 Tax=Westerdykella ornata TaxID=318751 RepID=A0A6A6JML1_WESOR|nr:uncharacterized protein EI97DRAFT_271730 [Westerdykella ornata]KAF2277732.1 hypothetical protein EI97DRAFT_271730 [Westerdykella ornata]
MEVAGIVLGGVGLAALFDSVVQCVDYTYLGNNFERDAATIQLRLEDTRARIHRWGRAVGVQDEQPAKERLGSNYEMAEKRLRQIKTYYDEAQEMSRTYLREHPNLDPSYSLEPDLPDSEARVRKALRRIYQPARNVGRKTAWALHGYKVADRLIANVNALIDGLELIAPREELSRLSELEVREIGDPEDVKTLTDANEQDRFLRAVAGHSYIRTQNKGKTRALMGDEISEEVAQKGITNIGRKHAYVDTTNSDDARVLMGNRIGVKKSFLD